jgi:hypothetical protein
MSTVVARLEAYSDYPQWIEILEMWLEFEDQLGYPHGQVCSAIATKMVYAHMFHQPIVKIHHH